MSKKDSKELIERQFLDGFLRASGLGAAAPVRRVWPDPPDFEVTVDSLPVGIEITRVFVDGPEQSRLREGVARKAAVCEHAKKQLIAAGVAPLRVGLGFAHDVVSAKTIALAQKIVELIVMHQPTGSALLTIDWEWAVATGIWDASWPQDLDHISMLRTAGCDKVLVDCAHAGWESRTCADLFQRVIEAKAGDLPRYSATYSKSWILLVAEGDTPASFFEPDTATREHRYRCAFDRAFFYRHAFPISIELHTLEP